MRKFLDDLLLAGLIVAAYEKKEQNMYPLEQFFPADKQVGVKLEYIKGAANVPVVLRASTYEDKATARSREDISLNEHKMPYFKEKMVVNSEQLLELKKMEGLSADSGLVKSLFRKIYDDRATLILGARARAEYLRSRLMCEGKITISSNGVEQTLDYGFDVAQKETLIGTDTWDNADAEIIQKINEHKRLIRDRIGINPNVAMTSSKVVEDYLMKNTQVLNLIKQINGISGNLVLSTDMVLQAIKTQTGITILVNDDIYRSKVRGSNQRFFDENKFVMFSTAILPGRTVHATTPQELIMGENGIDAEMVENSMVVLNKWIDDPVTKETIVDMVCLPSAEGAESIQIIEVAA